MDPRLVTLWRELLSRIDEDMLVLVRTFKKAYRTDTGSTTRRDDADADEIDPYAYNSDDAEEAWDQQETATEDEVSA